MASVPFQVWGGRGQRRETVGGISLLEGAETSFPLHPNLLLLQSHQDSRAQVSDKGWVSRLPPLQFGTTPPAAQYVNFYAFDLTN